MSKDPLKIGRLLNNKRYRVVESIKSGGFGETYVVYDTILKGNKALKRLKLHQEDLPQSGLIPILRVQLKQQEWEIAKRKFDREADILTSLGEHPQIPTIFDRFTDGGEYYIVQQLIDGHDLSTEIGREQKSADYVLHLIWDVLQILEFVHGSHVIHRDISPKNIMRRGDGRLVLVDFGNIKQIKKGAVTSTITKTGTEGFMAPEQDSYHSQPNTDIYALGVVAIYALTAIYPVELIIKIGGSLEDKWQRYIPSLNPNLAAIINKMVRYDWNISRYQTAQEVIADLKQHFPQSAPAVTFAVQPRPLDVIYPEELALTKAVPGILPLSQLSQMVKVKPKLWELLLFFFGSAFVTASVSLVLNAAYTFGAGQILAIYAVIFVVILFIRYKFFPPREETSSPIPAKSAIYLHSYNFPIITLNRKGQKIGEERGDAKYFVEELGNGVTLDMVRIPGGEFWMGTSDQEAEEYVKNAVALGFEERDARRWVNYEKPRHRVQVPDFLMGKFLVTQGQWQQVAKMKKIKTDLKHEPAHFKGSKELPVDSVNLHEAVEFCARLSKHTNHAYRLPSEAEWEYACRAKTETPFHFGATITPEYVNYDGNYPYAQAAKGEYRQKTTPMGKFPNGFGLYDMHGNLWEWCEDNFHSYKNAPDDGRAWINNDNHSQDKSLVKVLHGGSWNYDAGNCRSGDRYWAAAGHHSRKFGFRVACVSFLPRTR